MRTDIQGLRAIAVALVLAYHLWPTRLTGGFVGVDVFFVISGFLITSHLLSKPPRRPRDLATFWSRRIRRLLPASLTVLVATVIATRLVAPETQWANTARQVRAAALYVVNWRLADDAVDYSAAANAATPVQHFWSLSVEEQFYLGWPVLIAGLVLAATLSGSRFLPVVRNGLMAIVALSLAYSVWLTDHDPARAYFVTTTRVWELGVGGVLAALALSAARRGRRRVTLTVRARTAATWAGLVAIAWSAATYTSATPFPGWRALVPVLGTAAVIAAADPRATWAPGRALAAGPVQWLGGVSYSVYLWHWPLVVLVPYVSGGELGRLDRVAIVLVTLVLAGLTKTLIEDPFRAPGWGRPLVKPYVVAAVAMSVVVGLGTAQLAEAQHRERVDDARLARALQGGDDPCFGAAALDSPQDCPSRPDGPTVQSPVQAVGDRYDIGKPIVTAKCWSVRPAFRTRTCAFGPRGSDVRVALVGNSHAAQWVAALQEIADRRGWRVTTYLAANCALAQTPQEFRTAEDSAGCHDWVRRTTEHVARKDYDLIVMSNRISYPPPGETTITSRPRFADGYEKVLRSWQSSRERVLAIADTPFPGTTVGNVPECLAENAGDHEACGGPRDRWLPGDPVRKAATAVDDPRISSIDLSDHICGSERCAAVVGGVIVYCDHSHLTATYVRSLVRNLDRPLVRALRTPA